jgi:hypothetical protein
LPNRAVGKKRLQLHRATAEGRNGERGILAAAKRKRRLSNNNQ